MTVRAVQLHHDSLPVHYTALVQALFLAKLQIAQSVSPLHPKFDFLRPLAFPETKIAFETGEICECGGHTVHNLSQRCLTADRLAPQDSDCSRTRSKVSSIWLPGYIKPTRPVLEIFKMDGYFPNSPRMSIHIACYRFLFNSLIQACIIVKIILNRPGFEE